MNNLKKIIWHCKIVFLVSKRLAFPNIFKERCCKFSPRLFDVNFDFRARNMSQKSITSFFKKTPKKSIEKEQHLDKEESGPNSASSNDSETDKSPISNEKKKKSSKRQRLDSSDSDSPLPQPVKDSPSPNGSEKKKKTKRQRINSSSDSDTKPDETDIKFEKVTTPKTYESPKTKKSKVKLEKSPLVEKNEKLAGTSKTPPSKGKAKQEKSEDSIKKVKGLSAFIKTEKENGVSRKKDEDDVKSEKDEDGGKVPEEEYNPAKAKYHPIKDACWSKGVEVPYLALAKTLEAIEATSARLKIVEILANYFRSVIALTPEDLLPSVYLCLNQLAPAYHSLELGIAETYLMKAVGACTGRTLQQVKAAAQKAGDLGAVAEQARASQRTMFAPRPLAVRRVFAALLDIAHMTGQASVNKKIAKIQTLFTACRFSEARYLIRSLEGKLRIGLAEQSVLQALAVAAALTPPAPDGVVTLDASKGLTSDQLKARVDEQALIIKTTYCECPNYELVIPAMLSHGVAALPAHCRLTPGIPLKPMLAHPTKGLAEVFSRFEGEAFTCEWKYDGERAQIHVPTDGDGKADFGNAAIFSRNQENNTSKYPDILRRLPSLLGPDVTSCVLDAEAVAYDTVNKQIQPFQILSTRKRKDAQESDIKVQVCVFVFDLLYLNGSPLVREPLAERRSRLREHFREVEGEWQFATSRDCATVDEVQQVLEESIAGSCEGLMVKTLHGASARYDIARRSHNWLKIKKDYLDGVGDTIDAVVIGAWWGRGKRAGVMGGFLLAARDGDELQSLCKIGTGFNDRDLQSLTETLSKHIIPAPRSYYRYDGGHSPDVWVSAGSVWEVRCADLSLSPAHRAAIGLVDPDRGISLRFPRFVREREDKTPEEATSAQQIAEMYLAQDQVKNQAPRVTNHDDFY